jgi:hypothetical protein
MKIKNQKDFWAGVMFMAFGLSTVIIAALNYQMGSAVRMGPAYFPTVLGGILAVLGLVIFLRGFGSKITDQAHIVVQTSFGIVDLVVAVVIFTAFGLASKAIWGAGDYGMLAAAILLSGLAFFLRPDTRPLVLIFTSCLVFAYLLKPLGLVAASILLILVGALGGHEFKLKEVAILAVALAIFSVIVFVYGLTLPFPIWPAFAG